MFRPHSLVENEQYLAEVYPREGPTLPSQVLHDNLESTTAAKSKRRFGLRTPTAPHPPSRPSPLTLPPMPSDPPAHVPVPYPTNLQLAAHPTTTVSPLPTLPEKQGTIRRKLKKNPKPAVITEKESMTVLDRIGMSFSTENRCGDATPNMLLLNKCYTGKFIPPSFEGNRPPLSKDKDAKSHKRASSLQIW